jgi:hypothetical protein
MPCCVLARVQEHRWHPSTLLPQGLYRQVGLRLNRAHGMRRSDPRLGGGGVAAGPPCVLAGLTAGACGAMVGTPAEVALIRMSSDGA